MSTHTESDVTIPSLASGEVPYKLDTGEYVAVTITPHAGDDVAHNMFAVVAVARQVAPTTGATMTYSLAGTETAISATRKCSIALADISATSAAALKSQILTVVLGEAAGDMGIRGEIAKAALVAQLGG